MPNWVPIEDSSLDFTFEDNSSGGGTASLSSSVAITTYESGGDGTSWNIVIPNDAVSGALGVRFTALSYQAQGADSPMLWRYQDGPVQESQANSDGPGAWLPSPFSFTIPLDGSGTPVIVSNYDNSGEYGPVASQFLVEVSMPSALVSYNCDCDDENDNKTLKQLRDNMIRRLGWGAMVNNPPPGVTDMLNSFLQDAQELLYRRYTVLRTERFFSWPLVAGVRMYDLPQNQEVCTKKLDPRKLTWVGTRYDDVWYELRSGIRPELYSHQVTGHILRYEIRQCIEVWPVPQDDEGELIIKGHFGLEPFTEDDDKTTIDSLPVFLLALGNAKSYYGQRDAQSCIQQMEALIRDLTAGAHGTRRYVPGMWRFDDYVYVAPIPTTPFPPN